MILIERIVIKLQFRKNSPHLNVYCRATDKTAQVPERRGNEENSARQSTRKRSRNSISWLRNKRQQNHQSGESYISGRGKLIDAKKIVNKKDCLKCKFNCAKIISQDEQQAQFKSYYRLTQNEKYMFITNTTEKNNVNRKASESTKKMNSFSYFFTVKGTRIRVCKVFYLSTLCISQKTVYNVHSKMDKETNTPKPDERGIKSISKINDADKTFVKNHINSFPRVSSHYCRAKTSREYIQSDLNINKMYELYEEECKKANLSALKLSMYRHIFVNEFNIDFHMPKNDRCDTCELQKNNFGEGCSKQQEVYECHNRQKHSMREEKRKDKGGEIPLLIFDLQNVITCPKSGIGSFYYQRKLNLYNLTALYTPTKRKYCALWTEATSGRTGNDLSSALRVILDQVTEENDVTELITWSDSCVPQNRNSFMAYCILDFLKNNPRIKKITMKYSTPGHSGIQEVDNIHSQIEKIMKPVEFYSPLGFIRVLKSANKKNPYKIIQMQARHFLDFGSCAKTLNYKTIPFSKVCALQFTQSYFEIGYKNGFNEENFTTITIKNQKPSRGRKSTPQSGIMNNLLPTPKNLTIKPCLTQDKKQALIEMMRFMPLEDQHYFTAILNVT